MDPITVSPHELALIRDIARTKRGIKSALLSLSEDLSDVDQRDRQWWIRVASKYGLDPNQRWTVNDTGQITPTMG